MFAICSLGIIIYSSSIFFSFTLTFPLFATYFAATLSSLSSSKMVWGYLRFKLEFLNLSLFATISSKFEFYYFVLSVPKFLFTLGVAILVGLNA